MLINKKNENSEIKVPENKKNIKYFILKAIFILKIALLNGKKSKLLVF
jgi:hypothetical protein